jgi:hypothetical protein
MTDSTLTLAEVQAKITEIRVNITAAESALSYGKGDKQVARQSLPTLQNQLNKYLRHERELLATQSGATNAGVITPSWT